LVGPGGQGGVFPVSTVAQEDVPFVEFALQLAQQTQIVIPQAAHDRVEDRTAVEGKEQQELENWEPAAGFLPRGLRVTLLILCRVRQLG